MRLHSAPVSRWNVTWLWLPCMPTSIVIIARDPCPTLLIPKTSSGTSSTVFTFGLIARHFDWKWFFCPHLWRVWPFAGHWRFPCWYPQNLHSGRMDGSRGHRMFWGGSFFCCVLTAPTDSSVPLAISFNCWLVCSDALQMSMALDKVRSFTCRRRSRTLSSRTPRTKRSCKISSSVISSWAQVFAITCSSVTYALMLSPGSCLWLLKW